ncbi:MAG TPA: PKD domain-containing protein, partial [Chitinophagaceae bacterium]|nr:PKD domain-containing protein [Chitinophagaceae bacterium]
MKRLLTILLACAYLAPLPAQNSTCNAGFDYLINGKTVSFKSGNPTNHPQRHYWNFGDGAFSESQNPTHTYNAQGQYRVLHFMKDSLENCHDSVVKIITIQGTTCNITASFTFTRQNENCRKVKFTNTSIVPSSNVHFVWKFGDGTTSNDGSPVHNYEKDGNYKVCLVIETNDGCRVESCKEIEIRCSPPPPAECNVKSRFEWKHDA